MKNFLLQGIKWTLHRTLYDWSLWDQVPSGFDGSFVKFKQTSQDNVLLRSWQRGCCSKSPLTWEIRVLFHWNWFGSDRLVSEITDKVIWEWKGGGESDKGGKTNKQKTTASHTKPNRICTDSAIWSLGRNGFIPHPEERDAGSHSSTGTFQIERSSCVS